MEKQISNVSQLGVKNVSSTLKALQLGETIMLPNFQYSAIQGARTRIQIETGMSFKTKYDKETKTVSILRTA